MSEDIDAPSETDPSSAGLDDLLRRVEAATGPDREIDALLAQCLDKPNTLLNGQTFDQAIEKFPHDLSGIARNWPVPEFTASVDAALALAERVLPGVCVMVERYFDGRGWAMVQIAEGTSRQMIDGATPALAICAAVLRAIRHDARDGASQQNPQPQDQPNGCAEPAVGARVTNNPIKSSPASGARGQ